MTASNIILAPTDVVLKTCDLLDQGIKQYLTARNRLHAGRYEADVEALLVFNLGVRHIESIIALARTDLVLLPSAIQLSRAAFECCVRAAWLVNDGDPFRREARWLMHIDGEISADRRWSDRMKQAGVDNGKGLARATAIKDFRETIATALEERGVQVNSKMPHFDHILSDIGGENLYSYYIMASQYTHGGHGATWLYRTRGLGTQKQIGEYICVDDWVLPLKMCWLALSRPGEIVASRIAQTDVSVWTSDLRLKIDRAIHELQTSHCSHD
jgi:hypothetical protein